MPIHPGKITIAGFNYPLPNDRIAKHPLAERDQSKLLIYNKGVITQSVYRDLHEHLPADTLLIFNDTRVVHARLLFKKESGAVIEIFCLEPDDRYADITTAMLEKGEAFWECLIGGASKWKNGMKLQKLIEVNGKTVALEAAITARLSDSFVVQLNWQPADLSFAELLQSAGELPLPPYLHRAAEASDNSRYQTVYAIHEGSVAAPTAGLHFTAELLKKLETKGIGKDFVTLHVGAGTFKPVKAETMSGHEMHAEFIDVSAKLISRILEHGDNPIVAVGTTSLRTIESLYHMGAKVLKKPDLKSEELNISQWEVYETQGDVSARDALAALLTWMNNHKMTKLIAKTQILIAPSYALKIARGLITNFHQPGSTLLLLVAAVIGSDWRKVYEYALKNDFRFLSYGDGCLLWNNDKISKEFSTLLT